MRVLGVDVGTSSIGWALVEPPLDRKSREASGGKIIAAGVRLFNEPVNPKTKESLAKFRREKRSTRRMLRRKVGRVRAIKDLIIKHLPLKAADLFEEIAEQEGKTTIYKQPGRVDVWQLRHEGLHRKLAPKEFARVLVQIAKRRGYFSNSKEDNAEATPDIDKKKVLAALQENEQKLKQGGYRTIGEMFYLTLRSERASSGSLDPIRNKEGKYNHSVGRELLRAEAIKLFRAQRKHAPKTYTKEFEEDYIQIFFHQKPLKSVAHMVAYCEFEPKEKRAPKATLSGEIFRAVSSILNASITNPTGRTQQEQGRTLLDYVPGEDTEEKINQVLELLYKQQKVSYKKVRSVFNLPEEVYFREVEGKKLNKPYAEAEGKYTIAEMPAYHAIKKVLEQVATDGADQGAALFTYLTTPGSAPDPFPAYNRLATILSEEKEIHETKKRIREEVWSLLPAKLNKTLASEEEKIIDGLALLDFSRYFNLSLTAINKILPSMRRGLRYDEAVAEAYGYHSSRERRHRVAERKPHLPPLTVQEEYQITSPTVKRGIVQFRKVVNAIVKKYGAFDAMYIELGRELKHGKKERREIMKGQDIFKKKKDEAKEKFVEIFKREPKKNDLLKFRLYQEQSGRSPFKSNESIDINRLTEPGYVEIEHILPESRSLDDSLANKVLSHTRDNRKKGDRTPFEWIAKGDPSNPEWEKFITHVNGLKGLSTGKRNRLLNTTLPNRHGTKLEEDDFINKKTSFLARNLNDTRFLARFVKNYVEEKLVFRENPECKQKVQVRTGMLTANLRYRWKLKEKYREEHYHHVVDAVVLAFSTQSEIQRFSTISAQEHDYQKLTKAKKQKLREFKTICPFKLEEMERILQEIVPSFAPRRKIQGSAHEDTLYSGKDYTSRTKKEGGVVKKELTGTSRGYPVRLNKGRTLAKKDTMPRMDLFRHFKTGKYFSVPIYAADFVRKQLPNGAVSNRKDAEGNKVRLEMDEDYEFITSIYKNDFIEVEFDKEKEFTYKAKVSGEDGNKLPDYTETSNTIRGYFIGLHSGTGTITIESPYRKWECSSLGIQSAKEIRKYDITPLGEIVPISLPQVRVGSIYQEREKADAGER